MNIAKISLFANKKEQIQSKNLNSNSYQRYGIKMASPLNIDVVSFGAKANKKVIKVLTDEITGGTNKTASAEGKKLGATRKLAKDISNIATGRHRKVVYFIENIFKDLKVTEHDTNKSILKICTRSKSEGSIQGKTWAREGWYNKSAILENMEDINGVKIVLNQGANKKQVDQILDKFIPSINSGVLELLEVENKRPIAVFGLPEKEACKYDYASIKKLENLIDVQIKALQSKPTSKKCQDMIERLEKCKDKSLKKDMRVGSNYTAVHFIFRMPKFDTKFELQVIGSEVDKVKSVDDIVWKYLDNKSAPEIYDNIIGTTIRTLTKPENATAKIEMNKYRADLFLSQREKELLFANSNNRMKKKVNDGFITVKDYDLAPEFDYNKIFFDKEKCERIAAENTTDINIKKATDLLTVKYSSVVNPKT